MSSTPRTVDQNIRPQAVLEGAGVSVRRSIASRALDYLDPFLLLDHFESTDPADYQAGFPMHPHRGIETVTYVLSGVINHRDTLGNSGSIGAGDVQWMTAAGGIMHEEMPQVRPEGIRGFQLWVNLPAKLKMTRPQYRDVRSSEIPKITAPGGATVRVIAGEVAGTSGPVRGIAADPIYMDVSVPSNASFKHRIERGHAAFSYVFEGQGTFAGSSASGAALLVWSDGDSIEVSTDSEPVRFLLVSGKPLGEPVARYGPFVMNTRSEIEQALLDLRNGTFVWAG
jgi:redox-sensitive bicupin YhaK (pirin superfamily)